MLKHSHRGHGRSMLRAIAEVNACNKQFAAEWDPLQFSDPKNRFYPQMNTD